MLGAAVAAVGLALASACHCRRRVSPSVPLLAVPRRVRRGNNGQRVRRRRGSTVPRHEPTSVRRPAVAGGPGPAARGATARPTPTLGEGAGTWNVTLPRVPARTAARVPTSGWWSRPVSASGAVPLPPADLLSPVTDQQRRSICVTPGLPAFLEIYYSTRPHLMNLLAGSEPGVLALQITRRRSARPCCTSSASASTRATAPTASAAGQRPVQLHPRRPDNGQRSRGRRSRQHQDHRPHAPDHLPGTTDGTSAGCRRC